MNQAVALVTGFEAYGGRGLNPSGEVVKRLEGTEIQAVRIAGRVLPVSFRLLHQRVAEILRGLDPVLVLSLGLWPGEATIRLERTAVNLADFEIPDNEGAYLRDTPLETGAPYASPSRLPLREIERALLDAGIPARLSDTAGTFLCNATLYSFLQARPDVPCGFVHVPYLPEQVADLLRQTREERTLEVHQRADLASMHITTMVEAVRIVLATSFRTLQGGILPEKGTVSPRG
ncbi:MAG TPA: pyroglutamyl-peptidase I [bacterium]|nr:pyroglutamyl-peptidase I [bacterium]